MVHLAQQSNVIEPAVWKQYHYFMKIKGERCIMTKNRMGRMILPAAGSATRVLLAIMGLFLLISTGTTECWGEKQDAKDIMARLGKKVITRQDIERRIAALPMEYQMRFQTPEQIQEFLDGIIQMQVISAEARLQKLDKDRVVAQRIEDTVNSILVQEYMKQKMAAVKKATDQEIAAYYQSHKSEYINPAQVQAQHILIGVEAEAKPEEIAAAKAKAEGIRKEILAGGDFAQLAEKYSDDQGSKSRGGDLGFFTKDKMIPEFSQTAFGLKKGEISQPVKTGYGFHLIKVNEATPEKQMDLEEATPIIQASVDNMRRDAFVDKELDRLKKKYKVKITNPPKEKK
jgi:peptidyl-prolyl cis-trans isomerase C